MKIAVRLLAILGFVGLLGSPQFAFAETRFKVTAEKAEIRLQPETNARLIARARKSAELKVINITSKWCQVELPSGKKGWIHRSFGVIKKDKPKSEKKGGFGVGMFIPGLRQFQRGENTKAVVIIGGEVLSLAGMLYFNNKSNDSYADYEALPWDAPQETFDEYYDRANREAWISTGFGIFASALYGYNLGDGYWGDMKVAMGGNNKLNIGYQLAPLKSTLAMSYSF